MATPRSQRYYGIIKDCKNHESEQGKSQQRQEVANLPDKQNHTRQKRARCRPEKIAFEVVPGSSAPGNHGPYTHQKDQEKKQRHGDRVEIGSANADLRAGNRLREQWENCPQKDCKKGRYQNDIVQQKSRFPADHRIQFGLSLEQIRPERQKPEGTEENERKKNQKDTSDRPPGESVDRRRSS